MLNLTWFSIGPSGFYFIDMNIRIILQNLTYCSNSQLVLNTIMCTMWHYHTLNYNKLKWWVYETLSHRLEPVQKWHHDVSFLVLLETEDVDWADSPQIDALHPWENRELKTLWEVRPTGIKCPIGYLWTQENSGLVYMPTSHWKTHKANTLSKLHKLESHLHNLQNLITPTGFLKLKLLVNILWTSAHCYKLGGRKHDVLACNNIKSITSKVTSWLATQWKKVLFLCLFYIWCLNLNLHCVDHFP